MGSVRFLFLLALLPSLVAAKKTSRPPPVIVVSEASANTTASVETPVHYILKGGQKRVVGNSVAGERMPQPAVIEAEITKILASQGFLRTEIGGPAPELVLVYAYGPANAIEIEIPGEMDEETGETPMHNVLLNDREFSRIMGTHKSRHASLSFAERDELRAALNEDRLYIFLAALDATKMTQKERQLVWRTWISIPSRRNWLPDQLGLMLATAAPFLGRDSERPIVINDAYRRRRAEVEIGESITVEDPPASSPKGD